MAAEKVTLSLAPDTLERARASAEAEGINLSAWIDRAARQYALRDAGQQYAAWLAEHPDINDEVGAWRAAKAEVMGSRWTGLADAA
ncbi:hypothetical protein F4553_005257 [Allocatelliglobosispora scoriae]|uniref:Uncharacterized protein n=1 Tax=Allocatelliglobosispora scoriae TaxID=643052 RepID=A0A841BWL8_9ACTN|nr:hypothetical protein [Allocatelliglobosispora scoriae]MBB5871878.1 hypothetical protein [Allocatelliglobosispora scoriae]